MLLKAIVVEVINKYSIKIRIPRYDKIETAFLPTNDDDLCIAPICTLPGIQPIYKPGDVVIVGFENDLQNLPIVLGQLYCIKNIDSSSSINCDSLNVNIDALLTKDTNIGNISYKDLNKLKGIDDT